MIHSTVSPDTVKAAAKRAEPYAITVIDAPVTVTRYDRADAPFVCDDRRGETPPTSAPAAA